MSLSFKELGEFSKILQLEKYMRVYSTKDLPKKTQPEIVIIGKSNVGKSTLINTLINHAITKTSRNPGCTRWLGYLQLRGINIIDVPGYGFASVAKGRKEFWGQMMEEYIQSKRCDLALILVDSRRGIQAIDTQIAEHMNCPHIYLYTKYDQYGQKTDQLPDNTMAISSKNGTGIFELRKTLSQLIS